MIPDNFVPVIKKIATQCDHLGLTWAFTGSLNLALWGFDLEPHDIDLETDRTGAEQFDRLFADKAIWSLHLRESNTMQSYFARYDMDGVQVEVMGDCRYMQSDGGWITQRALEKRIQCIDWLGFSLPLLNLVDERESCVLMGRLEKAEKIRAWIDNQPKPSDLLLG
jgi:hypothetical protein